MDELERVSGNTDQRAGPGNDSVEDVFIADAVDRIARQSLLVCRLARAQKDGREFFTW